MLEIPTQKNASKVNSALRGDVIGPYLMLEQFRYTGIGTWKAVKASNTFTLTVIPSNNETVVIGGRTYTFKTALTPANGEVLIGASLAEAQANLVSAVNGDNLVAGLKYASVTRPNTQVAMSAFTANVSTLTALVAGTDGNSITTTETCANGTFSSATLTGGLNESLADGLLKPKSVQYNLGHTSSPTANFPASHFADSGSGIAYDWADLASNYDDLRYLTTQAKKFNVPNLVGSNYKRFAKITLQSYLSEQLESFGTNPTSAGASELDTNKFVIGDGGQNLQVIQINADGTITKGTVFTHANSVHKFVCVDTTKIIGIRNIGSTSYGLMTFTVSGTTISFGTETTVTVTGSGTSDKIDIQKIATGKCAFSYRNNTTTFGVRIADFTGAISVTASDTIVTPPGVTTMMKIVKYDTDKFCLFTGQGSVATSRIYAVNVTGTAIAIGSAYTPTIQITTDTLFSSSFSAFALSTTGIVFQAGSTVTVATPGFYSCFEQIAISGTTISFTTTMPLELASNYSPSGCFFLNTDTNKFVWYCNSASGINTRYNNTSQFAITFTVSGSTVTMSQTFRRWSIFGTAIATEAYRFIKVGTQYVSYSQVTANTLYPLLISKPVSVDIFNHETAMITTTITDPFLENLVDLSGLSSALINDDVAYLKLENNDASTNKIKIGKVLVEMES